MIDHAGFTCSLHVFTFAQTEKNQFLEAYLKYRVIIYTCQVETETKKRNKN